MIMADPHDVYVLITPMVIVMIHVDEFYPLYLLPHWSEGSGLSSRVGPKAKFMSSIQFPGVSSTKPLTLGLVPDSTGKLSN